MTPHLIRREGRELDQSHGVHRSGNPLVREEQQRRPDPASPPEARYFTVQYDEGIVDEENYGEIKRDEIENVVSAEERTYLRLPGRSKCPCNCA